MARLLGQLTLLLCASGTAYGTIGFALPAECKLIPLKPIFDTTYLPKKPAPFKLGVKHSAFIFPEQLKLRGNAKVVDLRGEESGTALKGGVSQTEPTSEINTVERGITAHFHLDLTAMIPKIAPDISRRLDAEIEKSRHNLATTVTAMPPPAASPPHMVPQIPQQTPMSPDLSKQIEAARRKNSSQEMKMPNISGGNGAGIGGAIAGDGGLVPAGSIKFPQLPSQPRGLKIPSPKQTKVDAKIAIPPNKTATDLYALPRGNQTSARLKDTPDLEALAAKAKLLSSPQIPTTTTDVNGELAGSKLAILWDEWHKRFAKLAGDQLLKRIRQSGNPMGANTVSVTVTPDQRLTVNIHKTSNSKFDTAVLAAYTALNGNASLAYPPGSLRSSVSFLVDNNYTKTGIPIVVHSRTLANDREEIVRNHGYK